MHRQFPLLVILLFVLLAAGVALQAQTCPPSVVEAITSIGTACADLEANSACYGNYNVQATFTQGTDASIFDQPSDRAPLEVFQSIRTAPYTNSEWGVAVLKLRANIPNALPGQAVTMLLLGDAQLQPVMGGSSPMQAFTFSTGIGTPSCSQLPPSSIVLQGPRGMVVDLTINGANIRLGSTVVLQTNDRRMQFTTLDGRAIINGRTIVSKGYRAFAELDDDGFIIEESWSEVEPMSEEDLEFFITFEELPDEIFEYEVDVPEYEEIELMELLGPDLYNSLEPYMLDELIDALLTDGIDFAELAEMSEEDYYAFLYDSLDDDDPLLADAFYEAWWGEDIDGDGFIAGFDADAYYFGDDFYAYGDEFEGMDFSDEGFDDEAFSDDEFLDDEPLDDDAFLDDEFPDDEPLDDGEFSDDEFSDDGSFDDGEFYDEGGE